MTTAKPAYKNARWGVLEKWVTRIAGLIIVAVLLYAMGYYGIHKENIDLGLFDPLFIVFGALLFIKVMINIMAPRKL